jgi:hypothetical protein
MAKTGPTHVEPNPEPISETEMGEIEDLVQHLRSQLETIEDIVTTLPTVPEAKLVLIVMCLLGERKTSVKVLASHLGCPIGDITEAWSALKGAGFNISKETDYIELREGV